MRTNTPLQALVLLNDPVILESARVFAERLMNNSKTDEDRIKLAFQSIVCRMPGKEELSMLLTYFDSEKIRFAQAPQKADLFIQAGEYPYSKVEDVVSLAALMQVVQTIYNLDEAITKT